MLKHKSYTCRRVCFSERKKKKKKLCRWLSYFEVCRPPQSRVGGPSVGQATDVSGGCGFSADDRLKETREALVVVQDTGEVLWMPQAMLNSSCSFDTLYFPFDEQQCELKFGSWTYNGFKVSLRECRLALLQFLLLSQCSRLIPPPTHTLPPTTFILR